MDILTILFGVLLGMFLTIGDRIAIDHRARFGFHAGLLTWLLLTLTPLIVVSRINPDIVIVGMLVGFVLSVLLLIQERTTRTSAYR
jgi:zinc transporter ZupT